MINWGKFCPAARSRTIRSALILAEWPRRAQGPVVLRKPKRGGGKPGDVASFEGPKKHKNHYAVCCKRQSLLVGGRGVGPHDGREKSEPLRSILTARTIAHEVGSGSECRGTLHAKRT